MRINKILIWIFAVMLIATSVSAGIYYEDFEDGTNGVNADNFTCISPAGGCQYEVTTSSDYVITGSKGIYSGYSATSYNTFVFNATDDLDDYNASMSFNMSSGSSTGILKVLFRYVDASNYYGCTLNTAGESFILFKNVSGSYTVLDSVSNAGDYAANGYHGTVYVDANGTDIKCGIDVTSGYANQPSDATLSATDSSLSSGKLGFNIYNSVANTDRIIKLDDIRIDSQEIGGGGSGPTVPTPTIETNITGTYNDYYFNGFDWNITYYDFTNSTTCNIYLNDTDITCSDLSGTNFDYNMSGFDIYYNEHYVRNNDSYVNSYPIHYLNWTNNNSLNITDKINVYGTPVAEQTFNINPNCFENETLQLKLNLSIPNMFCWYDGEWIDTGSFDNYGDIYLVTVYRYLEFSEVQNCSVSSVFEKSYNGYISCYDGVDYTNSSNFTFSVDSDLNSVLTTNLSSYSDVRNNFTVNVSATNLNNSFSCDLNSNNSLVSCSSGSLVSGSYISSCTLNYSLIRTDIGFTPYCEYNYNSLINYTGSLESVSFDNARFKINATDSTTFAYITGVEAEINSEIFTSSDSYNVYGFLPFGNYTATVSATGYADVELNIIVNETQNNYTIQMDISDIILINTFDVDGNNLTNINFTLISEGYSQSNTTGVGSNIWFGGLDPNNYTVYFSNNNGYVNTYYYVELESGGSINLDAYLIADADAFAKTFIIRDIGTDKYIENATITIKQYIGPTLVTISQKKTDYSGQALLYLDSTQTYLIRVTHPDYLVREVSLQPTSTSYTIRLGDAFMPDYSTIYSDISYNIDYASVLYQNQTYNFWFNISSGNNDLVYHGIWINNSGTIIYVNETGQPSGTSHNLTFTTGVNNSKFLPVEIKFFFKKGSDNEWSINRLMYAYPVTDYNITLASAMNEFSLNINPDGGPNLISGILATLLTLGLIGSLFAFNIMRNPQLIGVTIIVCLGFFSYYGFFSWLIWSIVTIPYIGLQLVNLGKGRI